MPAPPCHERAQLGQSLHHGHTQGQPPLANAPLALPQHPLPATLVPHEGLHAVPRALLGPPKGHGLPPGADTQDVELPLWYSCRHGTTTTTAFHAP